ncbi:MAG: type II secretion system secretin GspD [Magnetospirillum sp.]|nr:type II secretion system secretin GspD [Magnetospirillum sp.]
MSPPPAGRREALVVEGSGRFVRARPQVEARATESGDITFAFVDADIRQVVKAVLVDLLGRRVAVSPKVQGTVTVQTTQPVSRDAAFATLESVLRLHGIALVESEGAIKVVPYEDAPRVSGAPRLLPDADERPAGYGIEVVPLAYISAAEMKKMLEPMAPPGAVLQADEGRNIVIFSGTRQELKAMREMVDIFDVDWLKGMSFALIPLNTSDAKAVAGELSAVFGEGGQGPLKNLMRFVPVERINAVLAIATNPAYLADARKWVENFDRAGENRGQGRRLFVYPVQNGRAVDLAAVLDGLFGQRTSLGVASASIQRRRDTRTEPGTGSLRGGGGGGGGGNQPTPLRPDTAPQAQRDAEPSAVAAVVPVFEKGARIVADEGNNALVVLASPEEFQTIEQALKRLDVVPLQVLVEATIAEVTLNDQLRYGLQWFFRTGKLSSTFSSLASGAVSSAFPGFSFALQGTDARVVLNALSAVTTVNVVSAPTLMVLGNQTAVLQVGDQVPVAVSQARSVIDPNAPIVNTIQFRDTGVILRVTPRVNAGGMVFLDVEQEVSDVAATTTSTIDSPTIRQRRVASTVAVQSGETIALGGLIRDSRSNGKSGLPVLGDMPVLGHLFATTDDSSARTELLVLLAPKVVKNREDARGVTQELRSRLKGLAPAGAGR